jgi:replicative DNA helicase
MTNPQVLPNALELEQSVLGAMMIDRIGTDTAFEILKAEVFYKDAHKIIFEAISELYEKNFAIDILTVSNQLKKTNKLELAGGDFYIIQLSLSFIRESFYKNLLTEKLLKYRIN